MSLVDNPLCKEAFYYRGFSIDDTYYRIFNYRLASYSDFILPSALECRGIMFEVDFGGRYVNLVCRPMKKFFNVNEVSDDVMLLAETLIKQGRLSQDVFERAKKRNSR